MNTTALTTLAFPADLRELIMADGVDNTALSDGIAASFPVLSFRGKVWRVRYQGEALPILLEGEPVPAILCVIVLANPQLSKLYFEGAYEEGSSDAPTCFSLDGVTPDPSSETRQAMNCAVCPHNVWGSKITPQGTRTKSCSDSRRLAVVPYPDLENERYGGPMLLRVPPASFRELVRYSKRLDEIGGQYSAVVTRIGFDIEAAFPKLVMKEVRALTSAEYGRVVAMRDMETVGRMLSATEGAIAGVAPDPGSQDVGEAPAAPAAPVEAPVARVPVAVPAPVEAVAPEEEVEEEDEVAAAEAALAALKKLAKAKKAKAAKAAKAAAAAAAAAPVAAPVPAPAPAPAETAAAAAADTGVEVPAELANLLKEFGG
jgi:hypothetical protein